MTTVVRVVCTGPECTGKTTLAERLAAHFGGVLVAEFARAYAAHAGRPLTAADVEPIARGQLAAEERGLAAAATGGLVVGDTDLVSTVVYARHYYGFCPPWVEAAAAARRADLYLLHLPDVPWIAEPGQRGELDRRAEQLVLFARVLAAIDARVVAIGGGWDERAATAHAAVACALESAPTAGR